MNNPKINQLLEITRRAGLDKLEGAVYLALLHLGKASYKEVSLEAGINRTTAYSVIEKLKNKGIVSIAKKGAKQIIVPVAPERLVEIQKENFEYIQNSLGQLKSLIDFSSKNPAIQYFEGKEGLKTVLSLMVKEAKSICIFGDGDAFKQAIPGWTETFSQKRSQNNIQARIILKGTPAAITSAKKVKSNPLKEKLNKIRVLPESYNITGGFDVYGTKAVLYSFTENTTAVVIDNKIISNMLKTIFEILWNEAEKYDKTLLRN